MYISEELEFGTSYFRFLTYIERKNGESESEEKEMKRDGFFASIVFKF